MEQTVIVAPAYVEAICGVAAIKVGVRKMYACDRSLRTMFSCTIKKGDDLSAPFLSLVRLIAERAA
jgi:hypothetical protein